MRSPRWLREWVAGMVADVLDEQARIARYGFPPPAKDLPPMPEPPPPPPRPSPADDPGVEIVEFGRARRVCGFPGCVEPTEHHDCEALGCKLSMRVHHHYWYMHHGAHPVQGCAICSNLQRRKT